MSFKCEHVCLWIVSMWVKQSEIEDVYWHMCLWIMNNSVSENVSLLITVWVWVHVLLCERDSVCVCPQCPQPSVCIPWLSDSIGKVLTDVEPPPQHVLSEHECLTAGSTNLGAPNCAICPAMCSHVPAGSTQHRACLTQWLCDGDCDAPYQDQLFNEPGVVKCCC